MENVLKHLLPESAQVKHQKLTSRWWLKFQETTESGCGTRQ